MKNREYWKKRYQQLENASYNKSLKTIKELEPIFDDALKEIDTNIAKWYQRIAKNNEVSLKDAKKMLKDNELKEFRWTVDEYIKYGRENAINQQWLKELENASAKYHITKLEAQKIEVRQKVEELFVKEYKTVDKALKNGYKDSFYHSCYELEKGFNVGKPITKLDNKTLDKMISKPWTADGNNFSDRIWNSKTDLIDTLHKELTRMYTLGEAPDKAINNIAKKFDVSKKQAGRLVQTEMSYFSSLADKESYEKLGVKKLEIDATLDNVTCSSCGSLDGTVIDLKDYEIGVNVPPYHPRCRCTTVPWFEDEFDVDERIARGKDSKQFYVPSNMKYSEWKEKYLIDEATKTLKYVDITKLLLNNATPNSNKVKDKNYFEVDNIKYKVDGKNVVLDYSEKEKNIAEWLENTFGGEIYMIPRINNPQGIETPDYLFRNEYWDLKEITGNGKHTLDSAIKKKKNQSRNFIFDISLSEMSVEEARKQINIIMSSKDRQWVKQIILKKDEIVKAYKKRD